MTDLRDRKTVVAFHKIKVDCHYKKALLIWMSLEVKTKGKMRVARKNFHYFSKMKKHK